MKPFLILQVRHEDEASDGEYKAFLKFGKLQEKDTKRMRIEKGFTKKVDLDRYSGVILGGGPYNSSDAPEKQSEDQKRAEQGLFDLMDKIVKNDIPFLGICYGVGILGTHQKCHISKEKYGEEVGAVDISLTEAGEKDDLLKNIPKTFSAFVGHKEACQSLPKNITLLASSPTCPIAMLKIKNNIYATQFHPELDIEGIIKRIHIYKNYGYFKPEEMDALIKKVSQTEVIYPAKILENFVSKYKQN